MLTWNCISEFQSGHSHVNLYQQGQTPWGFLCVLKQKEINLPVTNSIWILEYTTASLIACSMIIEYHQLIILNQCILNLKSIKVESIYYSKLVTFSVHMYQLWQTRIEREGVEWFSDRRNVCDKGLLLAFSCSKKLNCYFQTLDSCFRID